MKHLYTCLASFVAIGFLGVAAVWFGYSIADACNTCLNRIYHAAVVRSKMRQCVHQKYAGVLQCEEPADSYIMDDLVWSPIESESYGPQRAPRKKRIAMQRSKKRTSSPRAITAPEESYKDLITHRGAPFSLPLPIDSFWLSSRFGPRPRADGSAGFHHGIDLAANKGTRVFAARSGIVLHAGYDNGYGKTIVIKHGTHFKTRYAHLDRISVRTGDTVMRGATIGAVGSTGHVRKKGGDGSHLHFEVYYHGKRVDPLQFLPELVS
jgi:murein DD-endopeptidase MepM/ murein hydrolase activator NlpD